MVIVSSCNNQKSGKHLFILSGQSNMARLDINESFVPILEKEFGAGNVIVVKYAKGTQPIRRWYRNWQPPHDIDLKAEPYLFDSLINRYNKKVVNQPVESVTFVWMQGERDARLNLGSVYEKSLTGLYDQLKEDIKQEKMNFIIGRINDFDMGNIRYPHWTIIREIQESVANSQLHFDWVNTDDLNDGIIRKGDTIQNDLHLSADGYKILGERFAEKAIRLIHGN